MHRFPKQLPINHNEGYFSKPYYYWNSCANDQILQKFIEVGETKNQVNATVGNSEQSSASDATRISKLSWIHHDDNSKPLYDFFTDIIDRINYWHYGMALTGMEVIQYTRYPVGGHYVFHNDVIARKENLMRKMSIVLAITDESEYEGGDFLISPHGGTNIQKLRFKKGDLIAFPSWVPHKVEPVTSGHRVTAVSWVLGPKFV